MDHHEHLEQAERLLDAVERDDYTQVVGGHNRSEMLMRAVTHALIAMVDAAQAGGSGSLPRRPPR